MNKSWLSILLGLLILVWLGQFFWYEDTEVPTVLEQRPLVANKNTTNINPNADQREQTIKKDVKESKDVPPSVVVTPHVPTVDEQTSIDDYLLEQLKQTRRTDLRKLSGYSKFSYVLEQECGNLIDSEIERAVIDVHALSADDIFISEHFCIDSSVWLKLNHITDVLKQRTQEQLVALQGAYDRLISSISDDVEKVIVTKIFIERMALYYVVFPVYERLGDDRYHLGALVVSPIKYGKNYYMWQHKFDLFNRLDIPEYVFRDILDNTIAERELEIAETYQESLNDIFAQQLELIEQYKKGS